MEITRRLTGDGYHVVDVDGTTGHLYKAARKGAWVLETDKGEIVRMWMSFKVAKTAISEMSHMPSNLEPTVETTPAVLASREEPTKKIKNLKPFKFSFFLDVEVASAIHLKKSDGPAAVIQYGPKWAHISLSTLGAAEDLAEYLSQMAEEHEGQGNWQIEKALMSAWEQLSRAIEKNT